MRTKKSVHIIRLFFFITLLSVCISSKTNGQVVWENYRNEVYDYLSRMAQKGVINFDDVIKPLTRIYIAKSLQEVSLHSNELSQTEKKELRFYLQEYANDADTTQNSSPVSFLKKDNVGRWRAFNIQSKDFSLNADPYFQGYGNYNSQKNYIHQSIGANLYGRIGKHIGFQLSSNDISESRDGRGKDSIIFKESQPGYVLLSDTGSHQHLNYNDLRANIGYSWKKGSISIGQDYLLWGYGANGRMVLSDKSPSYPYIRLDYQPFSWLKFQYMHAWLNSDVVDSPRTYGMGNSIYTGQRIIYVPKYMATHTMTFKANKTTDISIGESIIYSDQMNIGYLIPVMFFKIYDNLTSSNNISAGSNGQFFFQISSRNWLKNTHLYSTLFVDEIRVAKIFSKSENRNQFGFNLGASVTDIFIPDLTLNAEYTRVNPFVYANINPSQTYTNHGYYLGDWMGNNFDRIIFSAKYTPVAKLKCFIRYQYVRKGGPGTLDQQYSQGLTTPSYLTPFLFNYQYSQQEIFINFSYQWIHNLYLNAYFRSAKENNKISLTTNTTVGSGIGFSYGL